MPASLPDFRIPEAKQRQILEPSRSGCFHSHSCINTDEHQTTKSHNASRRTLPHPSDPNDHVGRVKPHAGNVQVQQALANKTRRFTNRPTHTHIQMLVDSPPSSNDQRTITRHLSSRRKINAVSNCKCSLDNNCSLGKERHQHRRQCNMDYAQQRILSACKMKKTAHALKLITV
jgi:hypothetical protein